METDLTKHFPTFTSIAQSARVRLTVLTIAGCVAITSGGFLWERTAAKVFAAREGHTGLFQTQIADYTYDYKGQNLNYEIWTIRVPFLVTASLLIGFGILVSRALSRRGFRSLIGLVWLVVIASVVMLSVVTFIMWWEYSGVFI